MLSKRFRFAGIGKLPYDGNITPDGRFYLAGLFGEDGVALLDELVRLTPSERSEFLQVHPETITQLTSAPPAAADVATWWSRTLPAARLALIGDLPAVVGEPGTPIVAGKRIFRTAGDPRSEGIGMAKFVAEQGPTSRPGAPLVITYVAPARPTAASRARLAGLREGVRGSRIRVRVLPGSTVAAWTSRKCLTALNHLPTQHLLYRPRTPVHSRGDGGGHRRVRARRHASRRNASSSRNRLYLAERSNRDDRRRQSSRRYLRPRFGGTSYPGAMPATIPGFSSARLA